MKDDSAKKRGLFFQILILLVLFIVVFILLRFANLIRFPSFIEKLFESDTEIKTELPTDKQDALQYIDHSVNLPELSSYPTISIEKMNILLNSLEPQENFYWESRSETFSSAGSVIKNCKSRLSGSKYNVEFFDPQGRITMRQVCDGEKTIITKVANGESDSSVFSSGIFDFYSVAGLISIDYFKDKDFSNGTCEIHRIQNDQSNLLSLNYSYDRNGVTVKHNFKISLDFGVVLFAEIFENDIPVFKQSTTSIYPLTSLDDKLFSIN